jgi:hypothetical protein
MTWTSYLIIGVGWPILFVVLLAVFVLVVIPWLGRRGW